MVYRLKGYRLISLGYAALFNYLAPVNLTYLWNFGVFALFCLFVQIITGVGLSMHYTPEIHLAFDSVEHIMRDVNYGWLLRYVHSNGASMFFIVVYIHTFRGYYYSSYVFPREPLWIVGVIILLLMIVIAFMGYVLPWGQMSFWGATVITNLMSAIPLWGGDIVIWLWGGYSVDNATLNRFFALHFLLPFVLLFLVAVHLLFLHDKMSNNPVGVSSFLDNSYMYPYFIIKDLYGLLLFFMFFSVFVFFYPNLLGHPDNYIPANPLVTPPHIVPEWYLLPFYTILRSIPDKLVGVLAMLFSIFSLAFLPFFHDLLVRSLDFRILSRLNFWVFFFNSFLLGWIGAKPIAFPFLNLGQCLMLLYFLLIFEFFSAAQYFDFRLDTGLDEDLKKKLKNLTHNFRRI